MKHSTIVSGAGAILLAGIVGAGAQTSLNEIAFNIDGTVADFIKPDPVIAPYGVDLSGFNTGTGLGTITYSLNGGGGHYSFTTFLDIEADFANGPHNDTASAINPPPTAGQHWEIGPYDPATGGPVYADFAAGTLTDANSLGATPTDVAMAMGFDFTLAAGDTATVKLYSSDTAPASGFYLEQDNTLSGKANYLYGTLNIAPSGNAPDGGSTFAALTLALAGLAALKSRLGRN